MCWLNDLLLCANASSNKSLAMEYDACHLYNANRIKCRGKKIDKPLWDLSWRILSWLKLLCSIHLMLHSFHLDDALALEFSSRFILLLFFIEMTTKNPTTLKCLQNILCGGKSQDWNLICRNYVIIFLCFVFHKCKSLSQKCGSTSLWRRSTKCSSSPLGSTRLSNVRYIFVLRGIRMN